MEGDDGASQLATSESVITRDGGWTRSYKATSSVGCAWAGSRRALCSDGSSESRRDLKPAPLLARLIEERPTS